MAHRMTSIFKSRNQRNNLMNVYRRPKEGNRSTIKCVSLVLVVTTLYAAFLYQSGGAGSFSGSKDTSSMFANKKKTLAVTTWNIAAINNNPFEYWITFDENENYEKIMKNVESFLDNPGDKDVPVQEIFTEDMFVELEKSMTKIGWASVRSYWDNDFKNRKIVSKFMKDPVLGSKRLASMPDRMTNTINVVGSNEPVCRPTVINMYDGDLGSLEKWWKAWNKFMFDTPLTISTPTGEIKQAPFEMLQKIDRAKYPDITADEEELSLPLQTMCGAIFDAILVHMMNSVSSPDIWQPLKKTMVENLNKQKVPHTLKILSDIYSYSDIITLQEVSSSLIDQVKDGQLGKEYWITYPFDMDPVKDQNSVIMLKKTTFPSGAKKEITKNVRDSFPSGVKIPVSGGDINAITADDVDGMSYVIVSFHGDTNGLATIPVNDAIVKTMKDDPALANHNLIFGLDANTYENAIPKKQQDVMEWGKSYTGHGLTSCWGDVPRKDNYSTYNSRTFLQPQLNKACKSTEKREKGDVNPKDFILFEQGKFKVVKTWKDNTGNKVYVEDQPFPTLTFPSDHGVLATILEVQT